MKINKETIIANFNKLNGFSKYNGINLESIDDNKVVLTCTLTENSLNPSNIAHGGLIFGLGDNACGVLAYLSGNQAVTINADINYLKPCKGKNMKCIATPIKVGKNVGTYKAEIYNEDEELASIMTCTYFFIKENN